MLSCCWRSPRPPSPAAMEPEAPVRRERATCAAGADDQADDGGHSGVGPTGAHPRDPPANPPSRLELLRRGRLLDWLAEDTAASRAQTGALLVHAGRNARHIRNFRRTESEDIAGAKPALIVLRECVTRCRQHAESQTQRGRENSNCEQINWQSRPLADRRCGLPPDGSPPWNQPPWNHLSSYRRECRCFKIFQQPCTEILRRRPRGHRSSPMRHRRRLYWAMVDRRRR
jgi:hypothetical protein